MAREAQGAREGGGAERAAAPLQLVRDSAAILGTCPPDQPGPAHLKLGALRTAARLFKVAQ